MNSKSSCFVFLLIILTYAWLGYSMLVLGSPIIAMAVYFPVFCIGGGYVLSRSRTKSQVSGIFGRFTPYAKPELPTILLAFLATTVLWLCTLLARPGMIDPELMSRGLESLGMDKSRFWYAAGFLAIANPFCEEYLWRRGFLIALLSRRNRSNGVILSALIFAGYHPIIVGMVFPPAWLGLIFALTFVGGIFLANLYLRTRSLVWPIALHLVININLMIIGYLYSPSSTP